MQSGNKVQMFDLHKGTPLFPVLNNMNSVMQPFPLRLPDQNLVFIYNPMQVCGTCPANLILTDLMILIILRKLLINNPSPVCCYFSHLDPDIIICTLFPHAP